MKGMAGLLVPSMLLTGCAAGARLSEVQLERIAILVEDVTPSLNYGPPPGKGAGGTVAAEKAAQLAAGAMTLPVLGPQVLALLPMAPVFLGIYALDAKLTVRSAEEVARANAALTTALREAEIQVALRNEIARLLHAETGRAPLVLMERRDARWLADHDVKAVVEVHVPVVSLLKMGELPIGNPALVFQMPVRFRVLDRSGEAEILRWQVEQRSSNMFRFFKWADEDAKRFREQLQRAVTSTAAAIVRRLH